MVQGVDSRDRTEGLMDKKPTIVPGMDLWHLIRMLKFVVTSYGAVKAVPWLCGVHAVNFRAWANRWGSEMSWKDASGERHYLSWDDKGYDEPYDRECAMGLCDRPGSEEVHFELKGHSDV